MRQSIFSLIFAVAVCASGTEPTPKLPSRDPAVVLSLLRTLPLTSTYQDVCHILGKPDLNVGSGSPDAIFTLADGSRVHVKTRTPPPDFVCKIKTITLHPPHRAVIEGEGTLLLDTTPKT